MNIQIGTAGLADELELRLSLACGLLVTSQLKIDIHAWKGRPCDMLVVDLESGYGRLAYEVATRRKLRILAFGYGDPVTGDTNGIHRLDRHVPAAALAKVLEYLLLPMRSAGTLQTFA